MAELERVGVRAVIEGAAQYFADATRINTATTGMASTMSRVDANLDKAGVSWQTLSGRMQAAGQRSILLGAALTAPAAVAVTTAIQFETAWAGVLKTVDASDARLTELRTNLLQMSREMPTTAAAIAHVAEIAGQLGIETASIEQFTKTMIMLGATTNLSADDAAFALSRLAAIMSLSAADIDRVGASLVALGNDSKTTEADIVEFALRIAGAGDVVGLTADQVLGLAAGLSSVGLNAEAGGTAISRTLVEISKAVQTGGDDLERFAQISGMSAEQFAKAFKDDAAGATIAFIEGLGRITEAGGPVFDVLDKISLGDIRVRDTLLRASGAAGLMRDSLNLSSSAWADNAALVAEYDKRLNTTAAQIAITRNQITAAFIDIGTTVLPVVLTILNGISTLTGAFASLPNGLQVAIVAGTALAGALLVIGGAMAVVIGGAVGTAVAVNTASQALFGMGAAAAVASVGLTTLTTAGIGIIAALAAATVAFLVFRKVMDDSKQSAEKAAIAQKLLGDMTREQIIATIPHIEAEIKALEARTPALEKAVDAARNAGRVVSQHRDALDKNTNAIAYNKTLLGAYRIAADQSAEATKRQKQAADDLKRTFDELAGASRAAIVANVVATGAMRDAAAAAGLSLGLLTKGQYDDLQNLLDAVTTDQIGRLNGVNALTGALNKQLSSEKDAASAAEDYARAQKEAGEAAVRRAEDIIKLAQAGRDEAERTRLGQVGLLADLVTSALRAKAQAELDGALGAIDALRKANTDAYRERIAQIDRTRDAAIKAIEAERDARVAALDAQIQAIQDTITAEQMADLQRQRALAFEPEEQAKIDKEIVALQRRIQIDGLQDQISAVKSAASTRLDAARATADAQKVIADRENTDYLAGLDAREKVARDMFATTTEAWRIEAAARVLIEKGTQDQIVALINGYAPQWRAAGKSLAEQLASGMKEVDLTLLVRTTQGGVPGTAAAAGAAADRANALATAQAWGAAQKASGVPDFVLEGTRDWVAKTFGEIPSFGGGGIVPGSNNQPVPIIAHAGERVVPAGQGGGVVFQRGAFEGLMSGATLTGNPDENARAIMYAMERTMADAIPSAAFQSGEV